MLYSAEKGNPTSTFRGKTWKLPTGLWRACNYNGQQCSFKLYNEAIRFAAKGKPINEALTRTQVWSQFKSEVLPGIKKKYERNGRPDKPARREAWNDYVDSLVKDGSVSSEAADGWHHPARLETENVLREATPPHQLFGTKMVKTKKELNYHRSGRPGKVPAGAVVELKFSQKNPSVAYFEYEGEWRATRLEAANASFTGIGKAPSMRALENMSDNGVATTPTGKRTEPDGFGSDGSPSWLLVLGMI